MLLLLLLSGGCSSITPISSLQTKGYSNHPVLIEELDEIGVLGLNDL
jgi:hypothetical protein